MTANLSLFSEARWLDFTTKVGLSDKSFELKTYPQLDPYFNFLRHSDQVRKIVADPSLQSVAKYPFLPFVKILTKTPRYRYQEKLGAHGLETKIRPIAFAAHFDSYIYGFYSHALSEVYQTYIRSKGFDECVLAYRSDLGGKSNIQFAKEVFEAAKFRISEDGECSAIALDITGYFDNIDHIMLKKKWSKILDVDELPPDQYKVFRSLTKYSYVNKISILKHFDIDLKTAGHWSSLLDLIPDSIAGPTFNDKFNLLRMRRLVVTNLPKVDADGAVSFRGIPQGSPMSAVLSNIYLIDFDEKMFRLSQKLGFTYRRYCDDLLIICNPCISGRLTKIILEEIKHYKLIIQPKKTELITFKRTLSGQIRGFNQRKVDDQNPTISSQNEQQYYKNLQYLGFEFNGVNIYIRPGSLSRYFRKMKGRIIKSIMMSYSNNSNSDKILKKQIFERYSHLGRRNFLSYAIKASKKKYFSKTSGTFRDGMDSVSIRRQLSAHFAILEKEIKSKSHQRFDYKEFLYAKKIEEKKRAKKIPLKK